MMRAASLASNDRGIAAVEFAIIAPVMLLMICGFIEFAYVSSARSTLEAATMRAARAVAANDCPSQRQTLLTSIVESGMSGFVSGDGQKVQVTTKSYSGGFGEVGEPEPFDDTDGNGKWDPGESYTDVNGNGQHDNDMGVSGSVGAAGQVVSYTARFRVRSLISFISTQFNGSNSYAIEASTVIRNEPVLRATAPGCT